MEHYYLETVQILPVTQSEWESDNFSLYPIHYKVQNYHLDIWPEVQGIPEKCCNSSLNFPSCRQMDEQGNNN